MDISLEGCATELRPVPPPGLTAAHRRWLNDPEKRTWRTWEVTVGFCKTFNLHPCVAGRLLAAWAIECWRGL